MAACAEIAGRFAGEGFRFAKSGPHARKKSGDFAYQVAFQSSPRNIAGVSVKLWVHGTVFSKKLEAWRKSHPELQAIDYVAGGQIGNLVEKNRWRDWDLADPRTRPQVIQEAIAAIDEVALPYFAWFDKPDAMIERVQNEDVPSMMIDRVVEFLMCFAAPEAARRAASNFLIRRPDLVADYQRDFGRYAERGLEYRHPSGYAMQLAFASHLYGFGDLTRD
jgi:hypothetical protein